MHKSVFNTSLGMRWDPFAKYRREWDPYAKYRPDEDPLPPGYTRKVYRFVPDHKLHDQAEQTQEPRTSWFFPPKTPERIQIDELREEIKTLKEKIKQQDREIEELTKQKETLNKKIKENVNSRIDPRLAILNQREAAHNKLKNTFGLHADVYNIMPRTENDTVNQYFIHTSFGIFSNTPKKSDNEVITELQEEIEQLKQTIKELQEEIEQLKQTIQEQQAIILFLSSNIG